MASQWLTVPNAVSVVRLALTAPLARRLRRNVLDTGTGAAVATWAATDWVDGTLARRFHQESSVGRVLDPVADRLGIAALAWSLAGRNAIPRHVPTALLAVDAATTILAGRSARRGRTTVSWLGKLRTVVLFAVLVLAASGRGREGHALSTHRLAILAAVLHAVTGWDYIRAARALPSPGPNQRDSAASS